MTAAAPVIRRLTPADAAAFRALRLEAMRAEPFSFASTLAEEEARPDGWFGERLAEGGVFGALVAGELVGMAGLSAQTSVKQRHKGHVWGMYVRAPARGLGLGRGLLEALLDHARGRVALVQLVVVSTNASAVRLYESLGFQTWGVEPAALRHGGGETTDLHMWRPVA